MFQAKTSLGTELSSIELNENNISEVLRLFVLSRTEGKATELSDQLTKYPLEALSPINKAAVLAFLVNELLCGKSVSRFVLVISKLPYLLILSNFISIFLFI